MRLAARVHTGERSGADGRRRRHPVAALAACASALLLAAAPAHADLAYDEMKACSDLGPKPPGSAAGRAEADRIATGFRAAGLRPAFEDFHLPVFVVRKATIKVVGGDAVPGETFAYGGTGHVEAGVVDVGVGRDSDYVGKDVKGRIVMVKRDTAYHRSAQLTSVIAHGGAAMLYVSGSPGNLTQTGSVRFAQNEPSPIPTVTVGADDGAKLRARIAGGLRLAIDVAATREDAVGRNVVAVRPGTTNAGKIIVVGGHYDNWHRGAIDNCTAVGSLLSVARAVKDIPMTYTVVFAAWDAEEVGLTGSYDWVMRHPDLVRNVVVDENLEMTAGTATAPNLRFGTSGVAMNGVAAAAGLMDGYTAVPVPATAIRAISGGIIPTDLQPFYSAGVQGFSTFAQTEYYHTVDDVPAHVDPASLTDVSRYLADTLVGLQDVPPAALQLREVPTVTVAAPATARPGAPYDVTVHVADPAGLSGMAGLPVTVTADQDDHWAVATGTATDLGGGDYRYTVPAGVTDADRTNLTATVNQAAYIAEGYATVDQTAGGIIGGSGRGCTSRRVITATVRPPKGAGRITRLTVRTTAGKAKVRGRSRVTLDLRGVRRTTVKLSITVRTSRHRTLRQTRTYRTCATHRSLTRAVGGV